MMLRLAGALVLTLLLAAPAPAQGQRNQRHTPGVFDFYVLALTWSPAFCQMEGARRGTRQCDIGRNRDFVVHGLWPQYDRGFPEECGLSGRSPTRADMEKAAKVFPDEGLARYQWRKHGSCSGSSPGEYFTDAAAAREKIVIPEKLRSPERGFQTSPIEVERAFVEANRGLRADMMSVQCNRNMLREVRICFSKDLRNFITCPEVNRSSCRARDIDVPAGR